MLHKKFKAPNLAVFKDMIWDADSYWRVL